MTNGKIEPITAADERSGGNLDSWEIDIALTAPCPRCDAAAGARCTVPHPDYGVPGSPSHIHPMRLDAAIRGRAGHDPSPDNSRPDALAPAAGAGRHGEAEALGQGLRATRVRLGLDGATDRHTLVPLV